MLVVDRHTLIPVDALDLVDEVLLHGANTLDLQELLGVTGTFDERITGGDLVAVGDLEATFTRDRVGVFLTVVADDGEGPVLGVFLVDANHT